MVFEACDWFPSSQDANKDTVSLTFSHDKQTDVLNLNLPEYSGVLVDCLQGECILLHRARLYI